MRSEIRTVRPAGTGTFSRFIILPAEFIADLPEAGGIAVADGAVESEGQLVCGCDDGEDLPAALPAQQLLHAGIELPPDAAVLRLVGEIAGDFGIPRIGSALKGAPGITLATLPDCPPPRRKCQDGAHQMLRKSAGEFRLGRNVIFKADSRLRNIFRIDGRHGRNIGRNGLSDRHGITSMSGVRIIPFGRTFFAEGSC